MDSITIYGHPRSTYTRTARLCCEEKGIDHAVVTLDREDDEYLALHPFRKMPAMRHEDRVLFETLAIAEYLDEAFDGPALKPSDPGARAEMYQWISAINAYVYAHTVHGYALPLLKRSSAPDELVEAGETVLTDLRLFDAALEDKEYLGGARPDLADLFLAPILTYVDCTSEGKALLERLPNLRRWCDAMFARASMERTDPMKEEAA